MPHLMKGFQNNVAQAELPCIVSTVVLFHFLSQGLLNDTNGFAITCQQRC